MEKRPGSFLRTAVLFYGGLALAAWGWSKLWGHEAALLGAHAPTAAHLLNGLLVGLSIVALCHFASALIPAVQRAGRILGSLFGPMGWVQALVLAIFSGLAEELFFRGALWPQLGLAGTTILFGILHVLPVNGLKGYPVFAAIAGLVFGLLRASSGSIWPAAIAHATVNGLNLAYLGAMERRRLESESVGLPGIPPRAPAPEEAPPDPLEIVPPAEPSFPVTLWRYSLRVEPTGTDRENLPLCLEHEKLALFDYCPREEVFAQFRGGRFVFAQTLEDPLRAFPEDVATISNYLSETVCGIEVAERYRDEATTDDVRAWKVLAQRGEWVKVPLLVDAPVDGRFVVEDDQYDVEVIAARWKGYPRWFQDGMRFRYPRLRNL